MHMLQHDQGTPDFQVQLKKIQRKKSQKTFRLIVYKYLGEKCIGTVFVGFVFQFEDQEFLGLYVAFSWWVNILGGVWGDICPPR